MSTYFSDKTFRFLRALARNNSREWFNDHRKDYEQHLKEPFQALITDLAPDLLAISPHYRADPRGNGGSLFRIHRDTRFSNDKTPYKTWGGARFFHARSKQVPAPSFYLHVQPGNSFLGAGIWHPDPVTLKKVRDAILADSTGWKRAITQTVRGRCTLGGDSLKKVPRGYDPDHPLAEDLKRKDFIAYIPLTEADACAKDFMKQFGNACTTMKPLLGFLSRAVGASW